MALPRVLASFALSLPLAALAAAPAAAQSCPGINFFKNDNLPAVPSGQVTLSVIPGLCEGEACGARFLLPGGTAQKIERVAVGFGSGGGASGATAAVNIEIYNGVSFAGAVANLGPKVFDYEQVTGANIQVVSTGINEVDLTPYNIVVNGGGDDDFVIAFRMLINPNGNCTSGFTSNFFTDNSQGGIFGCNPAITPQGKNLIFIEGQGWRDAALATVSGFPLCPLFYSGNWAIRACAANAGPVNPLKVTVAGSPVPPGGFATLTFTAPGYQGVPYVAAASFGTNPGIPVVSGNPPVAATIPLNFDSLFQLSLSTPSVFVSFVGLILPTGTAPGLILLPNNPNLSGLNFHVAFITVPNFPAPYGISDPALIQIQ
jgi:hypothetical protein